MNSVSYQMHSRSSDPLRLDKRCLSLRFVFAFFAVATIAISAPLVLHISLGSGLNAARVSNSRSISPLIRRRTSPLIPLNGQHRHGGQVAMAGRRDVITTTPITLSSLSLLQLFKIPGEAQARSRSDVSLLSADPVSDPKELLRRAIPVTDPTLDQLQEKLYTMSKSIIGGLVTRDTRDSNTVIGTTGIDSAAAGIKISSAGDIRSLASECKNIVNSQGETLAQTISTAQPKNSGGKAVKDVKMTLNKLQDNLENIISLVGSGPNEGGNAKKIYQLQQESLDLVGSMKEMRLAKFPFEVPSEYKGYDKLLGRAVAVMKIRTKDEGGKPLVETLKLVIDGYNAPVTAGGVVSLAKKGFYDGMEIQRSDGFIVQSGRKDGVSMSKLPLEIMVEGDKTPTYGDTLETLFRFDEKVRLPFNAQGTLAMARNVDDANSGDTQFFWLNKENDLTPSGTNVLDGRFAVFGYTVENANVLRRLKVGDVIESVKIVEGAQNLA